MVSVGNLSVGGTGKTPMIMYLIEHFLQNNYKVATLSRGYGRKTKGFRLCGETDHPGTVGDEPYTYFLRYGNRITVAVGEDRALAIPFILAERPETDIILLDDAFQHRTVKPLFQILLTTQGRPFWRDFVLPSGLLREARQGYRRADVLVITKSEKDYQDSMLQTLSLPVFKTYVEYAPPRLFRGTELKRKVIAIAGLADNRPFFEHVASRFPVMGSFDYPDHYRYKPSDIERIKRQLDDDTMLLTTEKDAVKLMRIDALQSFSCAYIPINFKFHENEERFLNRLEESLKFQS